MKVILTKQVEYDLPIDKMTAIPAGLFDNLVGANAEPVLYEKLPEVVVFPDRESYCARRNEFDFDNTSPVYVNIKGQIFRQLRGEVESNVTTGTEEPAGEAS